MDVALCVSQENQLLYGTRYSGTGAMLTACCRSQASWHSPQPMHLAGRWASVFCRVSTVIAPSGQAFAQAPQCVQADSSNRGMKCGGAIMPGALNSVIIRIPRQQQPQQEQDTCPLAELTFMIQVTSP